MSINLDTYDPGFPELTQLGKRIEVLRIQRGLSKQHLAKHAGTSRQQLWRVMTGKSELTSALCQRLSDVLGITTAELVSTSDAPGTRSSMANTRMESVSSAASVIDSAPPQPIALSDFCDDPRRLELALRLLPSGEDGRRLKRSLLNALEDVALERSVDLGAPFFELRRRVIAGDL